MFKAIWNSNDATMFGSVIFVVVKTTIGNIVAWSLFQWNASAASCTFSVIDKIFYFSDGAPQRFKNKKAFANLCYHKADFAIDAEWHFFAIAHGKRPCDGLAGSVKRLATRASLQMNTQQHLLTPQDLYTWATENFTNVDFTFITNENYSNKKNALDVRYSHAKTVKGTQALHNFLPVNSNLEYAYIKTVSTSEKTSMIKVF